MARYDWEMARHLHSEGKTDRQIAEVIGCSPCAVGSWRRTRSLPINGERLTGEEQQRIVDLLRQGKSCPEIQELTGVFRETVRKVGQRRGVSIPPTARRIPELSSGIIDKSGYILLRVSASGPYGNLIRYLGKNRSSGYALLHRIRMQEKLGRPLTDQEVVHHIDGDKYNNSVDNLELFQSNGGHLAASLKGKCPLWTEDGIRRIQECAKRSALVRSNRLLPDPLGDASPQGSRTCDQD
jgi:hypothetical protein